MRYWTEQEIQYLKANYGKLDVKTIAFNLQRTIKSIQIKAHKLNLKYKEMPITKDFFSSWNDTMAYLVGFFASDGNVFLDKDRPKFTFAQKSEKEFIEWIRCLLCPTHKVYYNSRKETYRIQFTSYQIYDNLCSIFDMPIEHKSSTILFPKIPQEHIRMFLLGCMDGDGSFGIYSKRKPRGTFTSGSIKFANRFAKEMESLTGLQSLVQKNGTAHNVMYQGIKAICFAWYLYHDYQFNLQHKSERAKTVMRYRPQRVWASSITPKMEQMFPHILEGLPRMYRK